MRSLGAMLIVAPAMMLVVLGLAFLGTHAQEYRPILAHGWPYMVGAFLFGSALFRCAGWRERGRL
ncbi:MAG TPA: hypothetical protein VHC68_00085 [Candidatus Paceibacterota bacterium]|nr:hypothetical protein [Candidatus Paceibacterota bacterium]